MLSFFYKNRKFVVVLMVATMVISGFGVSFSYLQQGGRKHSRSSGQKVAFVTTEGKKISNKTVEAISRFLTKESTPYSGRSLGWNFLNDNFVTREILTSKIGEALFLAVYGQSGFPAFVKELGYKPYRRFDAPFVSSEEIWKSSAPALSVAFHRFKSVTNPASKEGYEARVALFTEEKKFPYTLLKDMAEFRRRTYSLPHDPSASKDATFKLFGYDDLSDWFGQPFINALAEVVIRFSSFCESRGVTASKKEVEREFFSRAQEAYDFVGKKDFASLEDFITGYLTLYDLSLKEFLTVYRHIVIFQRGMDQVKGALACDYEPFREFLVMSQDRAVLDCYRYPKEMVFHSKADLEAFETYLRLAAIPGKNILDIPAYYLPVRSVKAKEPRLVGRRFVLSYATVSSKELGLKLSVSEVRDWQKSPQNRAVLSEKFPKVFKAASLEDAVVDFRSLDAETRAKLDYFSKKEILRSRPQEIARELAKKEMVRKEVFLSYGKDFLLEGISDGGALAEVLMETDSVSLYTQDEDIYYTFRVEERFEQEEIVSFKEAFRKDILRTLVKDHKGIVPIDNLLEALSVRYPSDSESVRILKRTVPLLEEHRSGILRSGTINWMPEKISLTVYRADADFPAPFSEMEKYTRKASPICVKEKEGPYYYIVHDISYSDTIEEVEQVVLIEKQLVNEVLGDYLSTLVRR